MNRPSSYPSASSLISLVVVMDVEEVALEPVMDVDEEALEQ